MSAQWLHACCRQAFIKFQQRQHQSVHVCVLCVCARVSSMRLCVLGGVSEATTTKELDSVESFVLKAEDEFIRAI